MKAFYAGLVCLIIAAPFSHAQGTFQLSNTTTLIGNNAPVLDAKGSPLWGSEWRVELYGGAAADSLSPVLARHDVGREIISLRAPGYFDSGYELGVIGVPGSFLAWVQVRVWSAALGATYEETAALGLGGYGESLVLHLRASDYDAHELPASLVGLQSFSVRPIVPEPATWALLVVGGLGLCWTKRCRRPLRRLQMDERPAPMHTS